MRSDEELERAKQALENRLEQYEVPLLLAFNQPKRDVVVGILHGGDDPTEVIEAMDAQLRKDLSLGDFIQIQSAKNAAEYCMGRHDSI